MIETVAWACALGGIAMGGLIVVVPGIPGCVVAFLGLIAFAGLTDFQVLPREAVVLAAGVALVGALAQLVGPALTSRALAGTAGAATGALVGAAVGAFVPIPGAGFALAVVGAALIGGVAARHEVIAWMRGVVGASFGCCLAAAVDALAVLACAAILGSADFARFVVLP